MESLKFYEAIAESLDITVEAGHLMSVEDDGTKPVVSMVGKETRELVLPTREILKDTDWDKYVAFAPLGENLLRGESEMIRTLLTIVKVNLNIRAAGLLFDLATLAANKDLQSKLDPEQGKLLEALPVVDDRFLKDLEKTLTENMTLKTHAQCLIDLNLVRNATHHGKKHARLCNVTFTVPETDKHSKLMGVTWRVKDLQLLQALHSYVFPESDVPGHYSQGTDSKVAPYLVALLNTYTGVQQRINELAKLFGKDFPQFKAHGASLKFSKYMGKLTALREELPVLQGNEGAVPKGNAGDPGRLNDPAPPPARNRPSISQAAANAPRPNMPEAKGKKELMPWEEDPAEAAAPAPVAHTPAPVQHQRAAPVSEPVATIAEGETISYAEFQRRQQAASGRPQQPAPQYGGGYYAAPPQPARQMTIHDVVNGAYNDPRYNPALAQPAGYDVGNSPYSVDYRAPVHAAPQQQQGYVPGTRYLQNQPPQQQQYHHGYQQPQQPRGRAF